MNRAALDKWLLDPAVVFLNHGSFGAAPRPVLDEQERLRRQLERQPVSFMRRTLPGALESARRTLGVVVGADPDGLVFVPNATTGINAVVRSLEFGEGDRILTTSHAYGAVRQLLEFATHRTGAAVDVADVPFPVAGPDEVVAAICDAVRPGTRLAVIDHVTSPTALVWPIEEIIHELRGRNVDVLVDGAHAPGMIDVALDAIGATYYAGNCHKWLCAPKGAGFLWVEEAARDRIVPAVVSHGYGYDRPDRSRFHAMFDWTGTDDPTPQLTVPAAVAFLEHMHEDGLGGVRAANHSLALRGRAIIADALGIDLPAPEVMIGSMVSIPLPASPEPAHPADIDPLQERLLAEHRIEVPVMASPTGAGRLLRLSAQLYNDPSDYERLATALPPLLGSS